MIGQEGYINSYKTGQDIKHSTRQDRIGQESTVQYRTGQKTRGQDRTVEDMTGQYTEQYRTGQDRIH